SCHLLHLHSFPTRRSSDLADFAVKHRLPSISHLPEFVRHGGLMSYGADRADLFRRAATYVDKILKGARPADLPVEQASKFQLVRSEEHTSELQSLRHLVCR